MLVGCGSFPALEPISRELPKEPRFLQTSEVQDPKAGESAIAVAARERAGRKRANATIIQMRTWYGRVRKSYRSK